MIAAMPLKLRVVAVVVNLIATVRGWRRVDVGTAPSVILLLTAAVAG